MSCWRLRACDIRSGHQWQWRLFDGEGTLKAEQQVSLDSTSEYWNALTSLSSYLEKMPDRSNQYQKRLLDRIGDWMGEALFGSIGETLVHEAPLVVRLETEPSRHAETARRTLFSRPLELARIGGKSLTLHRICFVVDLGEIPQKVSENSLRILALFSLPGGESHALDLRRERYLLQRELSLFTRQGFAVEVKVLQFGTTRDALETVLQEGGGWDVVHFSGHGSAGELLLEDEHGKTDALGSHELIPLLRLTRDRLKWVTLSSCSSAATQLEATRALLSLAPTREKQDPSSGTNEALVEGIPALAEDVASHLGCAVLAMRFPVADEFAIDLAACLYPQILAARQRLPRALATAMVNLFEGPDRKDYPPISLFTPTLFGRRALDLKLPLQKSKARESPPPSGFATLEEPAKRLVGRVQDLARASRSLAKRGEYRGCVFHGMAGAGKSACALELAWLFEELPRFSHLCYFKAPDRGRDPWQSLIDFAVAWDRSVEDFRLVDRFETVGSFDPSLAELSRFLESHSVLVILDNLESLLRVVPGSEGNTEWRNPAWARLFSALHDHAGLSRVVSTSRLVPQLAPGHFGRKLEIDLIPLHALHLDEALLLCRQLPNLRRLIASDDPQDRQQVRRVLAVVQGHPKLLELADGQAGDRHRLDGLLEEAEQAQSRDRSQLRTFLEAGDATLDAFQFEDELGRWTHAILAILPEGVRRAFEFVCCLEEADRLSEIADFIWPRLCAALDWPLEPAFRQSMQTLQSAALVEIHDFAAPGSLPPEGYLVHPGIAEAVREQAGEEIQTTVDKALVFYWGTLFNDGKDLEKRREGGGTQLVLTGRRVLSYVERLEAWESLAFLIDQMLLRENSPTLASRVLPFMQRVVEAGSLSEKDAPKFLRVLALALRRVGRSREAEEKFGQAARLAEEQGDFGQATGCWGELVTSLYEGSRYEEALQVLARKRECTLKDPSGPWGALADEAHRLKILMAMSPEHQDQAGQAIRFALPEMRRLLAASQEDPGSQSWNIAESLLDVAISVALAKDDQRGALAINHEILEICAKRSAPAYELARTRFNDYGPLISLGELDRAEALLHECRATFEAAEDFELIGQALSALASVASNRRHYDTAVDYQKTALRYVYQVQSVTSCAVGHFNLANHWSHRRMEMAPGFYHRLAGMMLWASIGSSYFPEKLQVLANHLVFVPIGAIPVDFRQLCREVDKVPGVDLSRILETVPKVLAPTSDELMQKVLAAARAKAPKWPSGN